MKFLTRLFGTAGARSPRTTTPTSALEALKDPADVQALLEACGFAAAGPRIQAMALPCLDMVHAGAGQDAPLGASRLGGAPDLPGPATWPTTSAGAFLSFFGQIDLADPAVAALDCGLPREGLLSLFVGAIEGALAPAPVAVVLSPPGPALQRRAPPGPPAAFDDSGTARLNAVLVRFERRLSFPALNARATDALMAHCPDGDIDALVDALQPPKTPQGPILGQVLGHAPEAFEDLREAVYFHAIGRPGRERLRLWSSWEDWERAKTMSTRLRNGATYRPWSAKDDEEVRWQLANRAQIDAGVERWRSLLTIASNKAMGLWINDADPVYTFIEADDLARGDVSKVRAIATQS